MKLLHSELFLCEKVFTLFQSYCFFIILGFLFFYNLILARFMFPGICPFILVHQFAAELSCIIISSYLVYSYVVNYTISLVTYDFIYRSTLSLILGIAEGLLFFLQHQERKAKLYNKKKKTL